MADTQQIKKTENYQMFKSLLGNRPIVKAGLAHLKQSIQKRNMLENNPINVNEQMQIIDGQHRLEAARELGLPIYYAVITGAGHEEMLLKNVNQRMWSHDYYLKSYISMGKGAYIELAKFLEKYKLSLSTSVGLLTGDLAQKNDKLEDFKLGSFEVTDREFAEQFAQSLIRMEELQKEYSGDLNPS